MLITHEAADTSTAGYAESKRKALELVDSLINDDYRVRDGVWVEELAPKKPSFLQVTLLAGNHYWFIGATAPPGRNIKVTLFDSAGHAVKLDTWKEVLRGSHGRVAQGFTPQQSGRYFIGMELLSSKDRAKADCSLVYAYK